MGVLWLALPLAPPASGGEIYGLLTVKGEE